MNMRARRCLALAPAILLLLSACGGGGGSDDSGGGGNNPPPPPPEQFTVGGTVSGLHGEIVLQINDGGDLSLTDTGHFAFADSLESGSAYEVTLASTPRGQTCDVANGSGTVSANVTDIQVTCADDPSAFYTVFTASGAASANAGLYAVFSQAIGDEPVHVTDSDVLPLGYSLTVDVDGTGTVSRGTPHLFFYATRDASGGDHVWAVSLSGRSKLAPKQLSSTTFTNSSTPSASLAGCAHNVAYEDLNDADSAFVLLELPAAGSNCLTSVGHDARKLIRLSDAAGDAATDLPAGIAHIQALYAPDGKLSGFVALDDAGNFNFYADETFTNPTLLRPAIAAFETLADPVSPLVLDLDLSATPSSLLVKLQLQNGSNAIYHIAHTGAISSALYTWSGSTDISYSSDAANLYVASHTDVTNFMQEIVKIRLNGTQAAQLLYSEGPVTLANSPLYVIGTIGSQLIIQRPVDVDPLTLDATAYIATLNLTTPAGLTVVFRNAQSIQARLRENAIFLNIGLDSHQYASAIIETGGTVIQSLTANTAFVGSGLQVRDIKSSTGVDDGVFYGIDINASRTAVRTPFRRVGGKAYHLPTGTDLPYARAVTSDIAVGIAPPLALGNNDIALTFDLTNNTVAPHAIAGLDTAYSADFF